MQLAGNICGKTILFLRRERSPSRDHRDRDRDRDRDNRRRDGTVDQDRSRDRRRRSPSAEPRGRSRRRSTADSDVEEAEEPERSESKKKKKKKKSKKSSDDEEAAVDEPPLVSLPHHTTEQEASDDGDDNLENVSIFNGDNELELNPAKGEADSASTDRPDTPPPPDPKKVLSKDYTPGLSGRFTGKKTNLEKDGDESEEEAKAVEVKAAKATPDKSAKTALEEKQANLKKMLAETEKQLQNEDLRVVLSSKDSEKNKLDEAYRLGKQAADKEQRSKTAPQGRDSRDLTQIPRSGDVPLGIPPEEWQELELERKISIRKIAQDPNRSLYFDWGNALLSGTGADVQKTLHCLATKPVHLLAGLFIKPVRHTNKLSAKESDKELASSIVKQAQQAFYNNKRSHFPHDNEVDEKNLVGFHKISITDITQNEHICSKLVDFAHNRDFNPMSHRNIIPSAEILSGSGLKSRSWWHSLIAAYSAVSKGKNLDEHNICMRAVALRRNKRAIALDTIPKHSACSDSSDSDQSSKSRGRSDAGDDSDRYKRHPGSDGWYEDEYTMSERDDWELAQGDEHDYMLVRMRVKEEKRRAASKAAVLQAKAQSDRQEVDHLLKSNGIVHSITEKDSNRQLSAYAQCYLRDQPTAITKEELADWTSDMLDLGAQSLWAIADDEKFSKWAESTVAGPKIGFSDDLKKSLHQLGRGANSGEKNRTIIDKLIPWFESAGVLNFVCAMYTGNVRFVVTDKTHFTLQAQQLCKDQCGRCIHELPTGTALAKKCLEFEITYTIKKWTVFLVEMSDTSRRLHTMFNMMFQALNPTEQTFHLSMGENKVGSMFDLIKLYTNVPLPVRSLGLAAQKPYDESVLKKKKPDQDIGLWKQELLGLINHWQTFTNQPYFMPAESDELLIATRAGVKDTRSDNQYHWQVMTRQRWMFILESITTDKDYGQILWELNKKERKEGAATSLDEYWTRLIDIQEYIRHRRLNDADAKSSEQVSQLQIQISKLKKQVSSIQIGTSPKEIASAALADKSAKQHENWRKPCVLCGATDCMLCTGCFKFCNKVDPGGHTYKLCKARLNANKQARNPSQSYEGSCPTVSQGHHKGSEVTRDPPSSTLSENGQRDPSCKIDQGRCGHRVQLRESQHDVLQTILVRQKVAEKARWQPCL